MAAAVTITSEQLPGGADTLAGTVSLRTKIIRSSAWSVGGYGLAQCVRIVSNMILTRLLLPADFGIASLVGLFVNGLQMVSDVGVGPSIIQSRRGNEDRFLNTAWTLSIGRGFFLWLLACVIAFPIASLYRSQLPPHLFESLMIVVGFNAVLSGFNSTALPQLNRRLELGKITTLNLSGQVLTAIVTATIALRHPSAWAIILGGNASTILTLVVSHRLIPGHRDRLGWDPSAFHELFHFGKWLFVSSLFTFFAMEIDRPLLARVSSISILGVYYIALMMARLPVELINRLTGLTLYPALARTAAEGLPQLGQAMRKARRLLLGAGVAASLMVALAAPVFFRLLYTKPWQAAGWMAQLMAIGGWATIMQSSADRALLALGQSKAIALSNGVNFVTTIVGCILGQYVGAHCFAHNFGLGGFIVGVALGNVMGHAVIEIALAGNGLPIFGQDLAYSLLLVGLVIAGLVLPHVFPALHGATATAWAVGCPLVIVISTILWAAARVWRAVRG